MRRTVLLLSGLLSASSAVFGFELADLSRADQLILLVPKLKSDANKMVTRIHMNLQDKEAYQYDLYYLFLWNHAECMERKLDDLSKELHSRLKKDASLSKEKRDRRSKAVARSTGIRRACVYGMAVPKTILEQHPHGREIAGKDWSYPFSQQECSELEASSDRESGFPKEAFEIDSCSEY
jgi:hypothetical protein